MKKQMIWGFATLLLLLGIATVFLLINTDTPPEPKYVLGQATKDQLKQGVKLPADNPNPQDTNTPDAENRPPPPGASTNGHWHGDEWHDEPHDTRASLGFPPSMESTQNAEEIISNHPAMQPQALADTKAIAQHNHDYKAYADKYNELREKGKAISAEYKKLMATPLKEVMRMTDNEKRKYADKLKANLEKRQEYWKIRDAHSKTRPIRPDTAFERNQKLINSLKSTNNR